ncbi:MAG: CehA/McbA family metallohydrolase [Terriglobia bacterium]
MPKLGWYSGDDHIHMVRMKPEQNEFLMTWARAEDVHVSNTLRMGDLREVYFEQMGYGKDSRYQQGDYVLVSGQEDPRMEIHEQGHAIALNITAPVRDTARYHLYDLVFDAVHAQGGLAGYAHFAWAPAYAQSRREETYAIWDATINVVRDKVDFLEILQFRQLGLDDYYDFLNLGYKLTASAGSDLPWGNTIGEVRMYVYTGEAFSADAWFAAMKAGRTFVTNGPMIELTVDNAILGDELKLAGNASLRIQARAWAPASIGAPKTLELVAQGEVIRSAESDSPDKEELKIDLILKAEASQWIAARVKAHNGALAHTSPVFVLVEGRSFRSQKGLPQLVAKRLKVLDFITRRLQDQKFVSSDSYSNDEILALTAEIEEARTRYNQLL